MLFEFPFEGQSRFLSHYDLWDVIPQRHCAHEKRLFAAVGPHHLFCRVAWSLHDAGGLNSCAGSRWLGWGSLPTGSACRGRASVLSSGRLVTATQAIFWWARIIYSICWSQVWLWTLGPFPACWCG